MKLIELTNGYWAKVDDHNYKWLNQWKWFAKKNSRDQTVYAARNITLENGKQTTIRMHRVIMNASKGMMVDHKDRDGLNNQEYNLRNATNQQNCCNKKKRRDSRFKYRGLMLLDRCVTKPFGACIFVCGKTKFLGTFATQEEAALAYNKAAVKYHGEFARLNVIEEPA